MSNALTDRQQEWLNALPQPTLLDWADAVSGNHGKTAAHEARSRLNDHQGVEIEKVDGEYRNVADEEPERQPLTNREDYIYRSLPATDSELAEDLGVSERVVRTHLDVIDAKGWSVEGESGSYLGPDQDHLRSSEAKQTRTKKANNWWQKRHDELQHQFESLEHPTADAKATDGNEDWVTHLTDLHAGDIVREDDGSIVYETPMIGDVIDHITQRSLDLAAKHNSDYDSAKLLWGGDFVTNEGIYEGQFEDLDAWLDEQHDTLQTPLVRQIKAFSEHFPQVTVVCQVGNHGNHRASGTSRQANADLILYKSIRNTVAELQSHAGLLENVEILIGEAKAYRNFPMRGGELTGHLRHGQHRKPQAETSARQNQWRGTLMDHDFDVAWMGHYHISGRIPWDGPPVFVTGSPKPAGEFVEKIGGKTPSAHEHIATAHGVSDDGVTGIFPIDTRGFTPT